ncbi:MULTISPECIES: hypothetical protein [unclassified Methylobacterium]|uniref:hypothetical protein n=1 Tax=unclassified Methylobacterium TaxID=2615210 RepID=UPI00226ACFA4|nr:MULTISPECIES: hypothetical protein [unclassified Methylobacterium]
MFQSALPQHIPHYGLVTHVDRQTAAVNAFKVWDLPVVRKEEQRLCKIIERQIATAPIAERPKPSLGWSNTIVEHLGADVGTPIMLSGSPHNLTFAIKISAQMMLHSAGMGLLKYLGYRCVLIVDEPIGYRYIKLPGTADENLERLERDGVWGLAEHALGKTPAKV